MAGLSKRFAAAGYSQPKYMLPLGGGTLFDWSVRSFEAYFASEHFTFILRDVQDSRQFIAQRLQLLGVKNYDLVVLDQETTGQAETVQIGIDHLGLGDDAALYIFNIDTLRPGIALTPRAGSSGGLEVFKASGSNWSFIEPVEAGSPWVRRCTEKVRISDYCCTGLYYFSRAGHFRQALQAERQSPSAPELYVAPLFNHLISRGLKVEWFEVDSDKVLLSGVPQEYAQLITSDFASHFTA
jgi:hypothetical protein